MRSLKSLLGSSADAGGDGRRYDGLVSFEDIIARFLRELRVRARRELGQLPERVVIGRPVHFVDDEPERDERARKACASRRARRAFASLLRARADRRGLRLRAAHHDRESMVLIVDIGGGTSDFTVVRLGPERAARATAATTSWPPAACTSAAPTSTSA
jgi:hypothetical chaperone protein